MVTEGNQGIDPRQPDALKFHLGREGREVPHFSHTEDEVNGPGPYTIYVTPDNPPVVEITQPAQLNEPPPKNELQIPADGVLKLAGAVRDDFGITKVALKMKLLNGPELAPQEFRNKAAFQLDNGTFMKSVEYFDFVDLDKLVAAGALKIGDTVDFWVEAHDNCDFPARNVGTSQKYRFAVYPPEKDDDKKKDDARPLSRTRPSRDKKHDEQRKNG